MPFAEDLSVFFSTDDFAVAATHNGTTTVNGIFDKLYLETDAGIGGVQGNQPVFVCKAADVSAVAHGDTLAISGTTYKVVGVEPDGTGLVLLRLEEQ